MPNRSGNFIKLFINQNMAMISIAMFSALSGSVIQVMLPLSIGRFTDLAFETETSKGGFLESLGIHIADIHTFFFYFFSLAITRAILSFSEHYFTDHLEEKLSVFLRQKLFSAQLTQTFSSFRSKKVSQYMVRYTGELTAIRHLLSKGIIRSTADFMVVLMTIFALFKTEQLLTMVLIGATVFSGLLMLILSKFVRNASNGRRNERIKLGVFIESRLSAWQTIKAFNRINPEMAKLEKHEQRYRIASGSYIMFNALQQSLLPLMFFTMMGMLLVAASFYTGDVTPSGILVFILLLLYLQSPLRRLFKLPAVIRIGRESLASLHEIYDLPSEEEDKTLFHDVPHTVGFRNVFFRNNSGAESSVANFKMTIGEIVWIKVGKGMNTQTMLRSLLKLESPYTGDIILDGVSIHEFLPFELRKFITVMGREYPLLGKSIFEAVSYSTKPEKRERAARVLVALGLCNMENAEEYLNTRIDQHTVFTRSELTRLKFARAKLSGKNILIMEDPFSGIDDSTKQTLRTQIEKIRSKYMMIVVSEIPPSEIAPNYSIEL